MGGPGGCPCPQIARMTQSTWRFLRSRDKGWALSGEQGQKGAQDCVAEGGPHPSLPAVGNHPEPRWGSCALGRGEHSSLWVHDCKLQTQWLKQPPLIVLVALQPGTREGLSPTAAGPPCPPPWRTWLPCSRALRASHTPALPMCGMGSPLPPRPPEAQVSREEGSRHCQACAGRASLVAHPLTTDARREEHTAPVGGRRKPRRPGDKRAPGWGSWSPPPLHPPVSGSAPQKMQTQAGTTGRTRQRT